MKKCTSCGLEKETTEFYKNKRRVDGLSSRCKQCDNEANTKTRHKDKEKANAYRRDRNARLRQEMQEYKQSKRCQICGEDEPVCLELHHLDPNVKDLDPSSATSMKTFLEEADKCVVLCSNCHKKLHAGLAQLVEQ